MKARFITDEKGNKNFVVLTIKEYKKFLEKIEDLEDVIESLKVEKNSNTLPWEDVEREFTVREKKDEEERKKDPIAYQKKVDEEMKNYLKKLPKKFSQITPF
jgi:hypothetical protein